MRLLIWNECVCVFIFWDIYFLSVGLSVCAYFEISIICVGVCCWVRFWFSFHQRVSVCAELKPARTWLQLATFQLHLWREKHLSYLKWKLFWWRGDRPNVLHYHHASCNLYQKPRVRQTKRERLHNAGAWCYPAEMDLSVFLLPPPPPLWSTLSLSLLPSLPLSHRGWIVLLRPGRGHGWEKCRGGS